MKLTHLATAVGAVVLLAACTPSPTTAAVVEGTVVKEGQVDAVIEGCNSVLDLNGQKISRAGVVYNLVLGAAIRGQAPGAETMTDEQLDQVAAQLQNGAAMLSNKDCAQLARSVAIVALAQQGGEEVTQSIMAADVQLNPRYGIWDPSNPNLFEPNGSLSVPAS